VERAGLKLPARVQGRQWALGFKGRFAGRFWPGVNLGVTVPGRHPGELAATRANYDRWLSDRHGRGHADGELARRPSRSPGWVGGRARLEPAADVHELADHRSAAPSPGADAQG